MLEALVVAVADAADGRAALEALVVAVAVDGRAALEALHWRGADPPSLPPLALGGPPRPGYVLHQQHKTEVSAWTEEQSR